MIAGEGRVIYVSGDTDVTSDMKIFNDLHHPDIGILSCGGHYTMDMARAAYAAKTFFDFKTVIPCHYRTFPILAQEAEVLAGALPGVKVIEPEVLVPIEFLSGSARDRSAAPGLRPQLSSPSSLRVRLPRCRRRR